MKIQIINKGKIANNDNEMYMFSEISAPKSFEEFDINIINLNDTAMWRNRGINLSDAINNIKDFRTLKTLSDRTKSNVLILYPQDTNYLIQDYQGCYVKYDQIKNITNIVIRNIREIFEKSPKIYYGEATTVINKNKYKSDFSFFDDDEIYGFKAVLQTMGKDINTLKIDNMYFTTLEIKSTEDLDVYLKKIGLLKKHKNNKPEWMEDIKMFNDEKLNKENLEYRQQIEDIDMKIKENNEKLENNDRLKSILYSSGEFLVEVVFDILEDMFGWDLSGFIDEKKEDFKYEDGDIVYIGEIKGLTSNVRNEYISQLDVHKQTYIDDHENIDKSKVRSILIINKERNKPLTERHEVNKDQESLAVRNESLVITTEILLKMYEKYLFEDRKKDDYIKLVNNKIGVLREEDL